MGKNRDAWVEHAALYSRVRYTELYPGIDLVFHGDQDQMEYDFEVAPGMSPEKIQLGFRGSEAIHSFHVFERPACHATEVFRMEAGQMYGRRPKCVQSLLYFDAGVISSAQTAIGRMYMPARKFPVASHASGVRNQ
jgi:hypothetical protein